MVSNQCLVVAGLRRQRSTHSFKLEGTSEGHPVQHLCSEWDQLRAASCSDLSIPRDRASTDRVDE